MITQRLSPGPRYPALLQLLRASEALWNVSRVFFARWDLSPSQFNVLNSLWDQPGGLSQVELSRQLIMHRSNATGLIDRLETRGLVKRTENDADRRAYVVVLTPAGRRLLQEVLPRYYEAAEKVWGNLTATRAKLLVADLERLSANAKRTVKQISD